MANFNNFYEKILRCSATHITHPNPLYTPFWENLQGKASTLYLRLKYQLLIYQITLYCVSLYYLILYIVACILQVIENYAINI